MPRLKLTDVAKINMGQSPSSETYNTDRNGLPFYQGNVDFGEKYPSARIWCDKPTKIAEPGDILISVRAPIGALNYAKEECCIGRGLAAITPDANKTSPEFIYWLLRANHANLNRMGTGSTFKAINRKTLEDITLPDYKKDEQYNIAKILSKIDATIHSKKSKIKQLDELVKARFVEMFGDESKYNREELANNVKEMFIGPFGSSLKNECFVEKEKGYCMVYEQKHAIQKTLDVPTRYVDEKKYNELKRFSVYGGDIIVSCRGTIGEIYIVPDDAPMGIMHPSIMKIRLDTSKYNQQFFVFTLEQYMNNHINEAKGSGVKMAVTATALGKEKFIVPPMKVQNAFASFVEQIDKSKFAVQKSLEKTQLLFDSLMQEYFG